MYRTQRYSDGPPSGGRLLPGPVGPVSKVLAILTGAGFLFMLFGVGLGPAGFSSRVLPWLAFSPEALRSGRVWVLFSHSFLGLEFISALFSVYFYLAFGSMLEARMGRWPYLRLWLAVSALPPLLAWAILHPFSGVWPTAFQLLGYLTPQLGLLWGLALLYPNLQTLLFFIIPVRLPLLAWIGSGVAATAFILGLRSGAGFAPLTAVIVAGVTYSMVRLWPKIALRYYGSRLNILRARRRKFNLIPGGNESESSNDHEVIH